MKPIHIGRMAKMVILGIPIATIMVACHDAISVDEQNHQGLLRLDVVSGQNQVGAAGTELPQPLVVKVLNSNGLPVSGQIVNFRVVDGGGSTFAGAALTNTSGIAQERWTLGPTPGAPQKVEVRAVDSANGQKLLFATFTATAQDPTQTVATVTVSPATASLPVGGTQQLTATAKNSSGTTLTGKTFVWTSSNTAVATVSSSGLVTAQSNGSATITATCEGRSGTATITVSGPAPAVVDTIFYENFESGTLTAWDDGVQGNWSVITNSTLAYEGTRLLRMNVPANTDGGHLAHFFMPGYDSVFVRLHVRYASNWTGNTYVALLRGSKVDDQWSSFGHAGECPVGNDWFATNVTTVGAGNPGETQFYTYWVGMPKEADGVTCYGRFGSGTNTTYNGEPNMTRAAWHRVEFWVKLDTPSGTNGQQKIWVDGQLVGTWTGINFRSTTNLKLNSLTILAYPDSQTGALRTIYYDEILVTRAPLPAGF